MATKVQRHNGSSWVDMDYQDWEFTNALHFIQIAPRGTVWTHADQTINANEQVRIRVDGTTKFEGYAQSGGRQGLGGQKRVKVSGYGWDLMEERISLNETSPTDKDVLDAALTAADRGSQFTLSFSPATTSLNDDYVVDDRPVKRVFRDIMDRMGYTWRITADKTIHVEAIGGRGVWKSVNPENDGVAVTEWDDGSIQTVRNHVIVHGTRDEEVEGSATDATSISDYGKRSRSYNVEYIISQAEADAMASALLIPDPLEEGEVLVGQSVGTTSDNLANQELTITDSVKGLSSKTVVIEKQTVKEGRATLEVGEGIGVSKAAMNRQSSSVEDLSEPGSVLGNARLGDDSVDTPQLVDTAVIEAKLADAAVATAKIEDVAVEETKIKDGSISTPKLQAEAVTSNEIKAGTIVAGDIAANTITASEIASGTITALEIAADTITANEIAAGTITAAEIDVLDLDAGEISIIDSGTNEGIEFTTQSIGATTFAVMRPTASLGSSVGTSADPFFEYHGGGFIGYGDFSTVEIDQTLELGGGASNTGLGDGEAEIVPDGATDGMRITVGNGSVSSNDVAMVPITNIDGLLGTGDGTSSTKAWQELHVDSIFEYSPEPLAPEDPRADALTDGGPAVDLDELLASSWYDPPTYASQAKAKDGTYETLPKREDGTRGVELGHMVNYLLEVCKEQQRVIEDLGARVDDLGAG